MNVVIVGNGRTGSALANSLAESGHSVTVIDIAPSDSALSEAVGSNSDNLNVLQGDGTRDTVLDLAKVREADLFASLTGSDSVNGLAALKAKIIYRVNTVIAAIWSHDLSGAFEPLGVACVNPARLSADSVLANIPDGSDGQQESGEQPSDEEQPEASGE